MIPLRSKEFLVQAGLPTQAGPEWRFGTPTDVPTLRSFLARKGQSSLSELDRFRVIGAVVAPFGFEQGWVCLDEAALGQVIQVAVLDAQVSWCRVNSSVERLAESLIAFHLIEEDATTMEPGVLADTLRRAIEAVDPPALADDTCFWAALAADAEQGI
jgi:hypothetical protein